MVSRPFQPHDRQVSKPAVNLPNANHPFPFAAICCIKTSGPDLSAGAAARVMSNPLLKPNVPRFQKPELPTGQSNPFADNVPKSATTDGRTSADQQENLFAANTNDPHPYTPAYTAQQRSRVPLLFTLAGLGWAASIPGVIALAGFSDIGWLAPLLGLGPAAAAWFLAYEDLKAIRVGAIAPAAYQPTRHAFWLGITGLLACAGIVAAMIFREMNFLPDVF